MSMRAVQFERFGGPEVLEVVEVPIPEPKKGEVRVQVHTASINPIDWKIRKGRLKFISGSKFPMRAGGDFAGVVDAVGPGVTELAVGDEVMGLPGSMKSGTFSDYVCTPEKNLVQRPETVSAEQGASVLVAMSALQALRNVAKVQSGHRVLLHGCTGGVGLPAIQLAKSMGAHVTGVCSTRGVELARQLGCDEVFDYRNQELRPEHGPFDAILDLSTKLTFDRARPLLTPRGIYVDPSPTPKVIVGSKLANLFRAQKYQVLLSGYRRADVELLTEKMAKGQLQTHIDRVFPLEEVQRAFQHAEAGGIVGKVVLSVA